MARTWLHMACTWPAHGVHMAAHGLRMARTWLHMACTWPAHGVHMAAHGGTWLAHGLHMARTSSSMACTWPAHDRTWRHIACTWLHMACCTWPHMLWVYCACTKSFFHSLSLTLEWVSQAKMLAGILRKVILPFTQRSG